MGAPFRRSRRGPITVTFDEVETSILDTLLSQLLDLLDAEDRPLARAAADAGDGRRSATRISSGNFQ